MKERIKERQRNDTFESKCSFRLSSIREMMISVHPLFSLLFATRKSSVKGVDSAFPPSDGAKSAPCLLDQMCSVKNEQRTSTIITNSIYFIIQYNTCRGRYQTRTIAVAVFFKNIMEIELLQWITVASSLLSWRASVIEAVNIITIQQINRIWWIPVFLL